MAIANAFCTSLRSVISDADSGVYSPSPSQFTASKLNNSAVFHTFSSSGVAVSRRRMYTVSCTLDGVDRLSPALKGEQESVSVPLPVVQIIQDPECDATTVEISFGDRLGLLIDTMKALKDLGLDVVKGIVTTQDSVKKTKFLITRLDTGRKVEDPDLLENIRLTIINNLIKYHPESSERLAMGEAFGIKAPEKKVEIDDLERLKDVLQYHCILLPLPDLDIATHIHVKDDGPKRSMLYVETADRSGLLMEVVKIMADINIHVESAEIDTEGLIAKDKFYVSYGGAALNSSLSQVLVNCLRYYLRRPETDEESY